MLSMIKSHRVYDRSLFVLGIEHGVTPYMSCTRARFKSPYDL